jgi:hypothetical protein
VVFCLFDVCYLCIVPYCITTATAQNPICSLDNNNNNINNVEIVSYVLQAVNRLPRQIYALAYNVGYEVVIMMVMKCSVFLDVT